MIAARLFWYVLMTDNTVQQPVNIPVHDTTTVTVMVKSPFWIYCYWELQSGLIEKNDPDAKRVLRLYDCSAEDALFLRDMVIENDQGGCSIPVQTPDRKMFIELGVLSHGDYLCLARTPCFKTPPAMPSPHTDSRWAVNDEDFQAIYRLSLGTDLQGAPATSFFNRILSSLRGTKGD